jgi:hypothetical protein
MDYYDDFSTAELTSEFLAASVTEVGFNQPYFDNPNPMTRDVDTY